MRLISIHLQILICNDSNPYLVYRILDFSLAFNHDYITLVRWWLRAQKVYYKWNVIIRDEGISAPIPYNKFTMFLNHLLTSWKRYNHKTTTRLNDAYVAIYDTERNCCSIKELSLSAPATLVQTTLDWTCYFSAICDIRFSLQTLSGRNLPAATTSYYFVFRFALILTSENIKTNIFLF